MDLGINDLNVRSTNVLLRNSHVMTIAASLLQRKLDKSKMIPVLIEVNQNSMLLGYMHFREGVKRCIVIVHGLEGSSESPYVIGLAMQAFNLGFNVLRLNLRNCGNTLHLTPTLYNAGQSEDLIRVSEWLKDKMGQQEQFLIGYSLGGNLVLKSAAEMGRNESLMATCAISPSIDLSACVKTLAIGFNKVYAQHFLYSLKKKILLKHKLFPQRFDLKALSKVRDLRTFDDLYTAPDAGYADAEHYYRQASAKYLLNQIQTDTLIVTSQDDPIVPFSTFANIENTNIRLLAPPFGGHVSFLNSSGFASQETLFWAEDKILRYCLQLCEIKEKNFV